VCVCVCVRACVCACVATHHLGRGAPSLQVLPQLPLDPLQERRGVVDA
jgi:hypothetical protein